MTTIQEPAAPADVDGGQLTGSSIEVLIPQVRRRMWRRRLITTSAILIAATVVWVVASSGSGGGNHSSRTLPTRDEPQGAVQTQVARVATVDLTKSDRYSKIAVVDGRILLYGSTSQLNNPEVANTCYSVSVNPSSLVLSDEKTGSCANPVLQGRRVLPVFGIDKSLPASSGGPSAVVRMAHVVPRSPGYALGPVVMTFPALAWSDSEPTWIYGGGDLWLYEWDNPDGFDLIRISASTGAVQQRIRVPKIQKAILAYNEDGIWIAPSGQTGQLEALYRVAPGATKATPVFHFAGDGFAKWIVASGDAVWVNAQPRPVSKIGVVWMLRGSRATPVWHARESSNVVQVFQTLGDSGMVGNETSGLWAAPPSAFDRQQVVRIDPDSGRSRVEATWKAGYLGSAKYLYLSPLTSWTGVSLGKSFFLLDPPAPRSGSEAVGSFSALYRITPSD